MSGRRVWPKKNLSDGLSMKSSRQGRKKLDVKIKCEFGSNKPPVPDLIPLHSNAAGIRKNGPAPAPSSKSGKLGRVIKTEVSAHDSNNNSNDVYNFDEDEDGSLDGVKRNIIPKAKNYKRRISTKSVSTSGHQQQPKYTSLKHIKQEALDDGGEERPTTLYKGAHVQEAVVAESSKSKCLSSSQRTPQAEADVVGEKKFECRKSSRRRPSVLYIEDPFEIILDSDEVEGFDFENGELFLDRKPKEGKRKKRGKGRYNQRAIPVPKVSPQLKIDITHEDEKHAITIKKDETEAVEVLEEECEDEEEEEPLVEEEEEGPVVEYRICPIDRVSSPSPPRQSPALPPPRVNPIFLWVRQEDTRIVDVRCEDYDKRNRIRLTKTPNGSWRAMPRTETNAQRSAVNRKQPRRAKEKKSKRKKKRHRRHRDTKKRQQQLEDEATTRARDQLQSQSCKVSLVPLPALLVLQAQQKVARPRNSCDEELTSDDETGTIDSYTGIAGYSSLAKNADARSSGGRMGRKTDDVPIVGDQQQNNNDKNNNVKIKHVRFALAANNDDDTEFTREREGKRAIIESCSHRPQQQSLGGQQRRVKTEGDAATPVRSIKLEHPRKASSPASSGRKPERGDAPTTTTNRSSAKECTSPLHYSCSSRPRIRSPGLTKGAGDKEQCLLEESSCSSASTSSSSDDDDSVNEDSVAKGGGGMGKVMRAAPIRLKSGALSNAPLQDHYQCRRNMTTREIENGTDAASPLVVTTGQGKQLSVARNNIKSNQCTESASVGKGQQQQTRKRLLKEEQQFAQGARIFASSDEYNIGSDFCGGSLHVKSINQAEVQLISEGEEGDEVENQIRQQPAGIVIGSLEKGSAENQSTSTTVFGAAATKNSAIGIDGEEDDKQRRSEEHTVEVAPVPHNLCHDIVVSEDDDDDVAFLCSSENANPDDSHRLTASDSNNNSCVGLVGGDSGDALSQHGYSNHQTRILTPEEQLHESLKATTELIAGIGGFVAAVDDLSPLVEGARALARCTMTGVDGLLDSLVGERNSSCEDNTSLSLPNHHRLQQIKMPLTVTTTTANTSQTTTSTVHTMCSGGAGHGTEDYNDDDELLLDTVAPVADIISRLSDSPKCLSFNEAGEIEAISASAALFEKHTMDSMDALTMSIKELAEKNLKELAKSANSSAPPTSNSVNIRAFVSTDSCDDDFPRDLTCKQQGENVSIAAANKTTILSPLPRPISRGSDAIQSPQPSGLPAVPPSPDIFLNSTRSKSLFLESILSSPSPPKMHNAQQQPRSGSSSAADTNPGEARRKHQQKEPLDLGTCRRSASPTVTCSEEVSKRHHDQIVDLVSELESSSASSSTSGGSSRKRIKFESNLLQNPECVEKRSKLDSMDMKQRSDKEGRTEMAGQHEGVRDPKGSSKCSASGGHLMDILNSSVKDPDPLTQLRLLISNTEWKVPETLLVPKDRLNAVLASPAREIPLLLTTRPELRLPGAFAFPSILQDPDILVVSLAQLEAILEKQQELLKLKSSEKSSSGTTTTTTSKAHSDPPRTSSSKPSQCISSEKTQPTTTDKQQEDMMHQQIQRSINSKTVPSNLKAQQQQMQQQQQQQHQSSGLLNNGLAGDIDAATIAAFNQMLWLPYLNQMRGQITPDLLKAIAGLNEMLPLIAAQGRLQQGLMAAQSNNDNAGASGAGSMNALNNSLEFAMWQEAMLHANQANLQRILNKGNERQSNSVAAATNAIELARKQLEHQQRSKMSSGMPPNTTTSSLLGHPRMMKQQSAHNQQLPTTPLSPLTIPPFVAPPVVQNTPRYFNPMMAAAAAAAAAGQQSQSRNAMSSQLNTLHSPFSPNYNLRQPSHGQLPQKMHGSSQRSSGSSGVGGAGLLSPTNQGGKKSSMMMPPNPFFPFGAGGQATAASSMDFDDQMNVLATRKAQKDFEQALQIQQQRMQQQQHHHHHQQQQQQMQSKLLQDQKPMKMNMFSPPPTPTSFVDPAAAKMAMHQHSQQQMFNQQMMSQLNELSKLSSLMTMPSAFDSPLSSNPLLAAQVAAAVNQQAGGGHGNQDHHSHGGQGGHQHHGGGGPKLKVKPGLHLLDPLAMQRRLLNNASTGSASDEMSADMVSTTTSQSGLDADSSPDLNSPLWHPLFGNSSGQKGNPGGGGTYTSPWQWTTVTAAGE